MTSFHRCTTQLKSNKSFAAVCYQQSIPLATVAVRGARNCIKYARPGVGVSTIIGCFTIRILRRPSHRGRVFWRGQHKHSSTGWANTRNLMIYPSQREERKKVGNSSRLSRFNSRDLVTFFMRLVCSFFPALFDCKTLKLYFQKECEERLLPFDKQANRIFSLAIALPPVRDDKNKNEKLLEELLPAARDCDHKKSAKRVNVEQPVGSCTSTIASVL